MSVKGNIEQTKISSSIEVLKVTGSIVKQGIPSIDDVITADDTTTTVDSTTWTVDSM